MISRHCTNTDFELCHFSRPRLCWSRQFVLPLAIAALLLGWPLSAPAQEEPEIDLPYLIKQLQEWRASFVSLHLSWERRELTETTSQPLPDWSPPENWQDTRPSTWFNWVWAEHGIDILDQEWVHHDDGGRSRTLDVFNADKNVKYHAVYEYPEQGDEIFKRLTTRWVGAEKPISHTERHPTTGLYWPGTASWLSEHLESHSSDWKLDGFEDVNGARCARVVGKKHKNDDSIETLWLDLDHNCLVRRYLRSGEKVVNLDRYIDEFQQLSNGIWFPLRGRAQMKTSYAPDIYNSLWTVTRVSVNQPLYDYRLDPPEPEYGTIVEKGGMQYVHGVTRKYPPDLSTSQGNEDSNNRAILDSDDPLSSEWVWWTIGISIVVAVLMFRRKRIEEKS